jgi:hypothetical protein
MPAPAPTGSIRYRGGDRGVGVNEITRVTGIARTTVIRVLRK